MPPEGGTCRVVRHREGNYILLDKDRIEGRMMMTWGRLSVRTVAFFRLILRGTASLYRKKPQRNMSYGKFKKLRKYVNGVATDEYKADDALIEEYDWESQCLGRKPSDDPDIWMATTSSMQSVFDRASEYDGSDDMDGYGFRPNSAFLDIKFLGTVTQRRSWTRAGNADVSTIIKFYNAFAGIDSTDSNRPQLREFTGNWDMSSAMDIDSMFEYCTSLTDISGVAGWRFPKLTSMQNLFYGCTSLTDLSPLSGWDVSGVTDIDGMFEYCTSLTDLSPLSGWDLSGVVNAAYVFQGCTSLTDLSPLSGWDLSSNLYVDSFFKGCTSLTDVSPFTSLPQPNCRSARRTFEGCTGLTNVDISAWESSIVDFSYCFSGCTSLRSVTLPVRTSTSDGEFSYMFQGCTSLETINMCGYNLKSAGDNILLMFAGMGSSPALRTIYYDGTDKTKKTLEYALNFVEITGVELVACA